MIVWTSMPNLSKAPSLYLVIVVGTTLTLGSLGGLSNDGRGLLFSDGVFKRVLALVVGCEGATHHSLKSVLLRLGASVHVQTPFFFLSSTSSRIRT